MLSSTHFHRQISAVLAGTSLIALSLPLAAQTTAPAPGGVPAAPAAPANAPKPEAARPERQRTEADVTAKRAADRAAFFDARVAAVHAGLKLTPDQETLWPPVDAAVHDLARVMQTARAERRDEAPPADAVEGLQRLSARTFARGTALKRLSDAITPFYASLSTDQKDRLPMLMHGMGGLGRRGDERPMGMTRGRDEDDRGSFFGGDERRGAGRMGDARGSRNEDMDGRSAYGQRRFDFEGRGSRRGDERNGYARGWRDED